MKTLFKLRPHTKPKTDFFVFDTETVKRKGNRVKYDLRAKSDAFYFGVIYGHNFTKIIYSIKEFITEFQDERYHKKKVFAHNAEYDLSVVFDNIYDFDPKAIFNGKFICATNGNCMFADSMNIYPTSVKKIGSMLGKEKGQLNAGNIDHWFDISKGVPSKDINYCIRDCEIVFDALFLAFEFAGQIKITQASLSLAYFKRYHLPFNIKHNPNLTKEFFKSYYGGRTECFKMGKTLSRVIDVNSMYPFAMKKDFPNPLSLRKFSPLKPESKTTIKKFISLIKKYEGTATIKVIHKEYWLGFLPVRHNKKLIFPIGEFSGSWNFPEIRFALEHNIIEIISVDSYTYGSKMKSPFISFVDHLYSERFKTNNEFDIYRIKIYMNSLYGKLAQRILEESTYLKDINSPESNVLIEKHQKECTFIKIQSFNFERSDAFLITKSKQGEALPYSIPSFASYVTSYGRIQLLKKLIDNKHNTPVYCDTDSIFLENLPPEPITLKTSNIPILGAWKLEDKIVTNIRGLKNYEYLENDEPKRALKGVPKTAIEIRPNVWEYFNLTKTKESLRRQIESGIKIKRTKVLKEIYDKRIVLENGETNPIEL